MVVQSYKCCTVIYIKTVLVLVIPLKQHCRAKVSYTFTQNYKRYETVTRLTTAIQKLLTDGQNTTMVPVSNTSTSNNHFLVLLFQPPSHMSVFFLLPGSTAFCHGDVNLYLVISHGSRAGIRLDDKPIGSLLTMTMVSCTRFPQTVVQGSDLEFLLLELMKSWHNCTKLV